MHDPAVRRLLIDAAPLEKSPSTIPRNAIPGRGVNFWNKTVWSPAAGALTFTRPARIRFVEFLRMRCQLADDKFLENIGGGGATDADERVCERQANSAILSRVVKI